MLGVSEQGFIHVPLYWWIGTLIWFCILLLGDLYFNRKPKPVSIKHAILKSLAWIVLALLLGGVIWWRFGHDAGLQYFSGYLIEKTLSIDNIFVWGIILTYLAIPKHFHYKVLFWGIFGAIVFRTIFVFAGIALIAHFQPILIFLGVIVLLSSIRFFKSSGEGDFDPSKSSLIRYVDKILPVSKKLENDKLIVNVNGKYMMTLLLFAICIIEVTDLLFAVDSVPAVLAVVRDPYIVLTSNIAAILGLRSLYFVFAGLQNTFWMLNKGLSLILFAIGIKLIIEPTTLFGLSWFGIEIPTDISLLFIGLVLVVSISGSLLFPQHHGKQHKRTD